MMNLQTLACEGATPEDLDTVKGILWAVQKIREQSGHGEVSVTVVDGLASEFDIKYRIRPKYGAPWRPVKKP